MALITRRFFTFAAPAIVAAPSLMRISSAIFAEMPINIDAVAARIDGMISTDLSAIINATLRNRSKWVAETVMRNNALLSHLSEHGARTWR